MKNFNTLLSGPIGFAFSISPIRKRDSDVHRVMFTVYRPVPLERARRYRQRVFRIRRRRQMSRRDGRNGRFPAFPRSFISARRVNLGFDPEPGYGLDGRNIITLTAAAFPSGYVARNVDNMIHTDTVPNRHFEKYIHCTYSRSRTRTVDVDETNVTRCSCLRVTIIPLSILRVNSRRLVVGS